MQPAFRGILEQLWIHMQRIARRHVGFFPNLANALEGNSERLEVLGLANGLQSNQTFLHVHQVVGSGTENGADFVVAKPSRSRKTNLARSRMKSRICVS